MMMAKFEDQLFDDLMRSHGSALDTVPERAPAGRRGVGRTLGIGGTALGVAGVIAVTGTVLTGGAPAYAVSKGADGVVTVSITDITGVTGANEELHRLGVRATAVPVGDGCVAMSDLPVDTASRGTGISSLVTSGDGTGGSMTFDADDIPEGDTLLLAARQSPTSLSLGAALIKGGAPECVSMPVPVEGDAGGQRTEQEVGPGEPAASGVREAGR